MLSLPLAPDHAARLLLRACVRTGRLSFLRALEFNPDQPRDDSGKWIGGGGGSSSRKSDDDEVFISSPKEAYDSIAAGERATVVAADVRGVVHAAADEGAGPVDLTNLTIEGTPIFAGGLNLTRDQMPQIPRDHQKDFIDELKAQGIKVTAERVSPMSLLPSQRGIDAVRVGQNLEKYEKGKVLRPIMVSKDDYVLDGHHRWAIMTIIEAEHPRENIRMPVVRIGTSHMRALRLMHAYNKKKGIQVEALAEFVEEEHPRDEAGKFTDAGGAQSSEELAKQAAVGVAAGERLLGRAVAEADYETAGGSAQTWDDLPSKIQDEIREQWTNNAYENGVDVDMSSVEEDMLRDLRRDNEKIIEEAEQATLDRLADRFPNENPQLPGLEGGNFRRIDPETLTVGEDDGEGASLVDLDQVRFTDGSELTAKEQELLEKTWNDEYEAEFEKEAQGISETDAWNEARSELESDALNEQWNDLSDAKKLALADNFEIDVSEGARSVDPGEPKRWLTGVNQEDMTTDDYAKTHAIATKMTELRMDEILAERGLGSVDSDTFISRTWSEWKSSSHSIESNALQLAAARELGGVHRLTQEELSAIEKRYTPRELETMQAYARAQWETTQYVMSRADQHEVDVYRAIYVPTKEARREYYDAEGNPSEGVPAYIKLPDTSLLRAGAQSTTATVDVANNWGGTGKQPPGSDRVVLRIKAPRTSVLSLPVFGKNEQEEHELVILGTKDKWRWDLWLGKAPKFTHKRLRVAMLRALAAMRKNRKIVIDLQAADRQLPGHWLKGTNPAMTATIARIQQKRGMRRLEFNPDQPRDESGKWTDGGGAELTPEQQFEKDKRDYLTPGEYAKLPPGIIKWKIAKRKAEAEAKKAGEQKPKIEVKPPEVKPPETKPELEVKPGTPTVKEREREISERSSALTKGEGALPWHEAMAKARQEDLAKHGPMPANTLRERLQAISDRSSELRQTGMKWDEASKQARAEDAAKHGPWLEPDQVKERAELIESDKHWSASSAIEKQLEAGAAKQIQPRPEINPKERTARQQAFETRANEIAREMGHDPNLVVVRDYEGRKFELNGETLVEGGHYNPYTGLIELNAAKDIDRGTVIHEIQHAQFDYVKGRADMERMALHSRWSREQADDFQGTTRYFTKDGKVKVKYAKEIEEQTPHLSLLARAGLGSRELGIKPDIDGLKADDGVSDYSKKYWIQAEAKGGGSKDQAGYFHELAVNETLSEVLRRQLSHNYHSDAKFGYDTPARFKNLGKKITDLYKQNPENVRRHFARKYRG